MADLSHRSLQEIENAKGIRRQLQAIADIDEDTIADTLEGEVNLESVASEILVSIDEDEMIVDGITARKRELDSRSSRAKTRIEGKRNLLVQVLEIAGRRNMKLPLATITLGDGKRKLADFDEAKVPTDYFKVPDPVVDKRRLLDALLAGEELDGIYLTNKQPTLTIRKL